jgi:hypothetical protein
MDLVLEGRFDPDNQRHRLKLASDLSLLTLPIAPSDPRVDVYLEMLGYQRQARHSGKAGELYTARMFGHAAETFHGLSTAEVLVAR